MESCTVAIEEFCTARPSLEVSLQLEAALFCIQAIVPDILQSSGTCSEYLKRCSSALGGKPPVVLSNPLTLARVCQLLQKVCNCLVVMVMMMIYKNETHSLSPQLTSWFVAEEGLDLASDLTMTAFLKRYPVGVERLVATEVIRESGLSLRKEASYALKELCCIAPAYFATDARLTVLLGRHQNVTTCISSFVSPRFSLVQMPGTLHLRHSATAKITLCPPDQHWQPGSVLSLLPWKTRTVNLLFFKQWPAGLLSHLKMPCSQSRVLQHL